MGVGVQGLGVRDHTGSELGSLRHLVECTGGLGFEIRVEQVSRMRH